jgi:hypothetical protein
MAEEYQKKSRKIYWVPSRLIEDPLTGENYVLMFGGSGRIRFIHVTDIQGPLWSEGDYKYRNNRK